MDAIFTSQFFSVFAAAIQLIFLRTILWGGKRCVLCAFFCLALPVHAREKEKEMLLVSQNNGRNYVSSRWKNITHLHSDPTKKCPAHFFPKQKKSYRCHRIGQRKFSFFSPKKYVRWTVCLIILLATEGGGGLDHAQSRKKTRCR